VFAEKGYDAASVREITTVADANLGAVGYHFGSKQSLYDAVLEAAFAPVRRELEALATLPESRSLPPLDRLERLVRGLFRHVAATGELPLLIAQQLVLQRSLPEPAVRALGQLYGAVAALIGEGQRRGEVRSGDPVLLAVSVISQPLYFAIVRRFLLGRLPGAAAIPMSLAVMEDHAVCFIRGGLSVHGEAV
jgi:AcrR family transcriptional regulator